MDLDIVMRWLHLVGAFTWLGGLIFVNLVLTPAVQPKGIPPQFIRLMGMERFRYYAWGSIVIVFISGLYAALQRIPDLSGLASSSYGLILLIKISVVLIMVVVTAINSIALKKKIAQAPAGPGGTPPPELKKFGPLLVILSRLNLVLGLFVLFLVALLGSSHLRPGL